MNTEDLYRNAQILRLPDYRDGFENGRISMRWWLLAAGVIGFMFGIVIAMVML